MIRGRLLEAALRGGDLAADFAQDRLHCDESVDHVRIELPLALLEDLRVCSAPAHGTAVGPMARHRIERIRDGEDARAERNLFADEAVGIAAPIPALVVRAHDLQTLALEEH